MQSEGKPLNSKNLLDFVKGLAKRDENDPVIKSFADNGIPQIELEDCSEVLQVLIQIYMGEVELNKKRAIFGKLRRWEPRLIVGGAR